MTLLSCWLICPNGWLKLLFNVRNDIRVPIVRPAYPFKARVAPAIAHNT